MPTLTSSTPALATSPPTQISIAAANKKPSLRSAFILMHFPELNFSTNWQIDEDVGE
jgi:hypothetical protein